MREKDETLIDPQDAELLEEIQDDEFASFFKTEKLPKIIITTSRRPSYATNKFASELTDIFPDSEFKKRGAEHTLKDIIEGASKRDYTALIVVNHTGKEPDALTIVNLPVGPTAHFKLTSIKLAKQVHNHGRSTSHKPEMILNNFNTRLGFTIGRFFASLFPPVPQFEGRQAVTFHNQRDFIFFRRHRYIFKEGAVKDKAKAELQEIGPRFTLKLKWLQKGTFDTQSGEYEWAHKPELDTSRKRFHI